MEQTFSKKYFLRCLPIIICASALPPLQAAESGYLDAVRADHEEFTTGEFKPPAESTWIGSQSDQAESHNLAYETLEDFSSFLKKESPGSFIFYTKLPEAYQNRLHKEYLTSGNLEELKQSIFKYSSEVKKQNRP